MIAIGEIKNASRYFPLFIKCVFCQRRYGDRRGRAGWQDTQAHDASYITIYSVQRRLNGLVFPCYEPSTSDTQREGS